ncbi:MAG TPA: hypothetical protein VGL09_22075 [Methylomirabilota bacterium]|jgi:hypothetical protein
MDVDVYLMEWIVRERLQAARAMVAQARLAAPAPRPRTPLERALGSLVAWTVRWPAPSPPFGRRTTEGARPAGVRPLP